MYKHYGIQNHTLFHVSIHTYIHPKHTALAQWAKSPCLRPILCLQKAQTTVLIGMSGIKQCGFFSLLTSSIERCVWGSRGDNCERNNSQSHTHAHVIVEQLPQQRYHVHMHVHTLLLTGFHSGDGALSHFLPQLLKRICPPFKGAHINF